MQYVRFFTLFFQFFPRRTGRPARQVARFIDQPEAHVVITATWTQNCVWFQG